MAKNTVFVKIWRVVYPVVLYFLLNLFVSFVCTTVLGMLPLVNGQSLQERVNNNTAIISIIHMALSLMVFYLIYKNDYVIPSKLVFKTPKYLLVLVVIGALASHGLSTLVSFLNIDGLLGSYTEIEAAVFSAKTIPVILQTVIFAPLAEELVFRGFVYRRAREYSNFWIGALVSSALFGFYHFNLAQGIFAFIYGFLLCAVYEKMRNLWSNIAVHMGGNAIAVVLTYTGFKYPALWIYAVVMVLALAAAWVLFQFVIQKASE